MRFDYRFAQIEWKDNRWQLRAGETWLKDFGKRESDAREAVRLVRDLRLTQRGTVGTPRPIMEYWLSDGHAPVDNGMAHRSLGFDQQTLRVEVLDKLWYVRDEKHILLAFGPHEVQARQALAILHEYGFNEVLYIGQPVPLMMVFLKGQGNSTPRSLRETEVHLGDGTAGARSIFTPASRQAAVDSARTIRPASISPAPLPTGRQLVPPSARPQSSADPGESVPFDWRRVQVRQDGPDWKVVHGDFVLADLGQSKVRANQALSLIQHYRFTEQRVLGDPIPHLSYFLVNGQAPRGLPFGVEAVSFQPDQLNVLRQENTYVLGDGNRVVFRLGDNEREANEFLKFLRKERVDVLGRIGDPGPHSMTFLARSH